MAELEKLVDLHRTPDDETAIEPKTQERKKKFSFVQVIEEERKREEGLAERIQSDDDVTKDGFIDVYLSKMSTDSSWEGREGMQRLLGTLDSILSGADGIALILHSALAHLAMRQHWQKRVREEVRGSRVFLWNIST